MNPLAWLFGDLPIRPRFIVPVVLGIGAGVGLFYATGKEPSSAAIAVGCALLGLIVGFVLEYLRDTPRGPLD
jgi:hypothetical protein